MAENDKLNAVSLGDGRYKCPCGYIYDPAKGDPKHDIPVGTKFEDLPDDWRCPRCNRTIEDAMQALERSGVRDVFFKPDDYWRNQTDLSKSAYPYKFRIREDKYYDEFLSLENPELRVQDPIYTHEWRTAGFTSAKAENCSFRDGKNL